MTTTIDTTERLISAYANRRREQQRQASGRHAVEEIYRLQGEKFSKEFDWAAHANERVPDTLRAMVREFGETTRDIDYQLNDYDIVREAFSSLAVQSTFSTKFGSQVLAGYGAIPDTTAGLVREIPSKSFLQSDLATLEETARLYRRPKGRTAEHVDINAATTPRSVAEYAAQIKIDEQNMVDSETTTGVLLESATELGRAARRTYLDLVWAKFLRNPAMYDDVALFHANHGNLIADVLAAAGLLVAMQKLSAQVVTGKHGEPNHLGLTPKYLYTPAALIEKAREVCRLILIDGDSRNITPIPESRLGATGAYDPEKEQIVTSSDTCWMLAAPAAQRPAVIVSYLEGSSTSPQIRQFDLSDRGQWGLGWDVTLRVGVAFADWRTMVFSSGA